MGQCTSKPVEAPKTPEFFLTSTAIPKTVDNEYEWTQSDWLIPHEPIRREMLRVQTALERLDLVGSPWHIERLHSFLDNYFIRAVHFHHDNEEEVVGPYFAKLGESVDFGKAHTHKELVEGMDAFLADVTAAKSLVGDKAPADALRAAEAGLRAKWVVLHAVVLVHLEEEEQFWPAVYRKHDPKHADAVVNLILKRDFALKGPDATAAHAFTGAVFDAMGAFDDKYASYKYTLPAGARAMGPWCSERFKASFMRKVPFIPRLLIIPGFHRVYVTKWRAMIESIGTTASA